MKIRELTLVTDRLDEQEEFYRNTLQFNVDRSGDRWSVLLKNSTLRFLQSDAPNEKITYHFALDIPYESVEDALDWLENQRVEVLPFKGEKIVKFPSWDARAIYFYDPAGNVVEWIGRRELNASYQPPFSSEDLLHISEIGTPVLNVSETGEILTRQSGEGYYSGPSEDFAAIGDAHGLFILVQPDRKNWMPKDDPIEMCPWEMDAVMRNYPNGILVSYQQGEIAFSKSVL